MSSIIDTLRHELKELNAELDDIYAMSEEAACECYNVECKTEVIELMNDKIQWKNDELEKLEPDVVDEDEDDGWWHPAFRSEASFWAYKF